MGGPAPNPPVKHHYIPAFYLKRRTGADGKLCQFTNPIGRKIAPVRRAPDATGFLLRGYELKGFKPELAQQVETAFFQPVDNAAHDALVNIEVNGNKADWTKESRSAWTRFILSLLLRCPEDISAFREFWKRDFVRTDAALEAGYLATKEPTDPPTYREFLAAVPEVEVEQHLFEIFFSLVDHPAVGERINSMIWRTYTFPLHCYPLLTSDRPMIRTNGLAQKGGHLALPIGPRRLFVASHDPDVINGLWASAPKVLAAEVNKNTVESAVKYVYGVNDANIRFVENRFGRTPQPRIIADMVAKQEAAYVAGLAAAK